MIDFDRLCELRDQYQNEDHPDVARNFIFVDEPVVRQAPANFCINCGNALTIADYPGSQTCNQCLRITARRGGIL